MATKAKAKLPVVQTPRNRPWFVPAAVIALLIWYFVSAVSAVSDKSTTFDEALHLTGGYCSWKFGDFRMQPENGNLPQRWATIPLLFGNTRFPQLDQKFWASSNVHEVGERFLYEVGNDADGMMLRGRAMIALLGVALGALLFFWTRSLLGVGSALASLWLFAFCPTELANGALVTSDMAAALFFAASMLCIWRVLHRVTWQTLLIGSLAMSGLFLSKFSAFLLLPMGLLLLVFQLISRQPTVLSFGGKTWQVRRRAGRLGVHLATIAVHAFVVWGIIWACYNFRYDMFAAKTLAANQTGEMTVIDRPLVPWDKVVGEPAVGVVERSIVAMRDAHVFPEAYLYGFAATWHFAKHRDAFLNGEYRTTGWRTFFPYCLLVKTPLPLFVLIGLAVAAIVRNWLRAADNWRGRGSAMLGSLYRTAPAWTLFIVYWTFAITSHLNIGHRHILPTYLPMLMLAGGSWLWTERRSPVVTGERRSKENPERGKGTKTRWSVERRRPVLTAFVLVSLGSFAGESLWRWPNYLAYFNQLAGGPSSAYRHLVDSSLDWGQDLPALKRWLVKNRPYNTGKTYLAYFGSGNPEYYGIRETLLPCFEDRMPARIPEPLEAGTYCISATLLENTYTTFAGRWNKQYEKAYHTVAAHVHTFVGSSPEGRNQLIAQTGEDFWATLFRQYEHLRFARLTSFLRQREPDFEINYSILVYRLEASDLARALDGPPIELAEVKLATEPTQSK
jgi:hypothetical protein